MSAPVSRSEALVGALVATAALLVYVATLYPEVPGGDSGELIGALATGGVVHPPGYPLYALLGRLFLHVPHGSIAWRVNLFSAVCDALAAGTLFVAVARWTGSPWGGVAAAALFAFAPGVWMYAISAEVFALNNLFVALLLLIAVLYSEARERRFAYAGALASGLALANHHTVVFVAAPLAAWTLWIGRRDLVRPRPMLALMLLVVAGLAPYATLFARRSDAVISWGTTDTWPGFWTHVLRRDYGPLHVAKGQGGAHPSGTLTAWLEDLARQLRWWSAPLLLVGLGSSVRDPRGPASRKGLGIAVAAALLLAVTVFGALWGLTASDPLHRQILARFWQEPDIVCFAWCGWGVAEIGRLTAGRFLAPLVTGTLTLAALGLGWPEMDHHASRVVRDYGAEILRAAPPGAVLFTKGDLITNTTRYLQLAEGMRPDVRVIDQELLGYRWYARQIAEKYRDVHLPAPRYAPGAPDGFAMKQLLDLNFGQWPILTCGGVKEGDLSADKAYGRWPHGLCEIIRRGDEPVNVDEWLTDSEAALPHIVFGDAPRTSGSWEDIAWGDYWEVRTNRGVQLMSVAGADPSRRRYLVAAATIFEGILDTNPSPRPQVYKDLVLANGRQGLATAPERARQVVALRRYLRVAPPDDPALPGLEQELARLSAHE